MKRADNPYLPVRGYRLCVYASGALITEMFCCLALINVSFLHFGQNRGKFSNTVFSRILVRVLLPHIGHSTHSLFNNVISPCSSDCFIILVYESSIGCPSFQNSTQTYMHCIRSQYSTTNDLVPQNWLGNNQC